MSCIITYKGSDYLYVQKQRYWVGYRRGRSSNGFVGLNCVAPLLIQQRLKEAAIEAGTDPALFRKPIKEKKVRVRKPRAAASNKNSSPSISIF